MVGAGLHLDPDFGNLAATCPQRAAKCRRYLSDLCRNRAVVGVYNNDSQLVIGDPAGVRKGRGNRRLDNMLKPGQAPGMACKPRHRSICIETFVDSARLHECWGKEKQLACYSRL